MTHDQLFTELRTLAPAVAFSVHAEHDPYFAWDGDGEAPDDMEPHNVEVRAEAVRGGRLVSGTAHLGGHYLGYGEEPGDISGYLPQLLEEAADELSDELSDAASDFEVVAQLTAVSNFLRREMRDRYNAQRAELESAG